MTAKFIGLLLPLLSTGSCAPSLPSRGVNLPLPVRTVAQLASKPTWLENIAVRANGDLLVTQLAPAPVLYAVQNPSSPNATLHSIYQWHAPNVTTALGIVETTPDTFILAAGNATSDSLGYAGTWSVWQAHFSSASSSTPTVRKITNLPSAKLLNGIAALPAHPSVVLIADSQAGLLFRVDTTTGKSAIIADRPEFKPHPELQNATVGFGINGVKIRAGYVYFSNSNFVSVFRVRITPDGYVAANGTAPVELYADLHAVTIFVDDFAVGEDGALYVTSNLGNTVVMVAPGGRGMRTVAGSSEALTVAGATAGAFGRTKRDRKVLYVCTAGALARPVNGTITEPGKIVALDTEGLGY